MTSSLRQAPGKSPKAAGNSSVSLATLAAHLNLSQAAISRVLNHAPAAKSIPPATQKRIFEAAREFNYRPNALARSLRRGHSLTIGVLVPEISEGYTTLVLAGLEHGLLHAGYAMLLCSHHHNTEVIERSQITLSERAVDGIVAIDTLLDYSGLLPVVTVSCPIAASGTTNIVLNHIRAAELALEHLVQLGHRKIAFIRGQVFSSDTNTRWNAICEVARRIGLILDPDLQVALEGDAPTHLPGYVATQRLLSVNKPFTALFAFNDVSAIGAVRALRDARIDVPTDVSVIGFDDVQSAAFQNPSLTTVHQPLREMGVCAAEGIVNRIASSQVERRDIVVEPQLILRESTTFACAQLMWCHRP